jgi:SNF2 family DNA or RNA helicase
MFHRTRLGLGALLADDMGLGKTVQLISLLLALKEAGAEGGPTLLVCPASLVGNWERELARFAPGLRLVRHHGEERRRDADALARDAAPHDVVLTTYGLVRRDARWLAQVRWGTVVCDEAQNLKNPQAAQARAVRSLEARRRVALSGTPVENRLSELWSLMEFLNPGLLGSLERFRRELALPIERDRDARAVRWLQAATRPFLLRRLKTDPDVAPELPEKEVIRTFCSLSEEQAALYQKAVEESLAAIEGAEGIERQGRVLKLLTRLKQVCNHPAQLEEAPGALAGRSGKLERAAEMLEEVVASGDRALVFTQYVRMGELLVRHLGERLGVEVPLFHGGLDLEARDRMVRRFQEAPDGPPVLVLSLRAGGVGLNLTRANHVLHYDRWWNPAVEDQATDRAHRIGQTRRVQVHHLVTMGTLEERIDRMLEEKRQLADAVIEGGEAWLSRLSTDELRALVSLGSDAAVESVASWDGPDSA